MPRVLITDAIGVDVDHLDVPGSLTVGNDRATDTMEVVASVSSDLVPDANLSRNLGFGGTGTPGTERQWQEVHQNAAVFTCGRMFCNQFTHTTSTAVQEDIEVVVYNASDFVAGRVTVWLRAQGTSNSGIREYVFASDETSQTAQMDLIGGAQASTGTQPLDVGVGVTYVPAGGGSQAQFVYFVQNVNDAGTFPIGTTFEGKVVVWLLEP